MSININHLPKYAPNNDSVLPKHDELNPGPEGSTYDVRRHEEFKLRYSKRVLRTRNRLPALECYICTKIITSGGITIGGKHYHGDCFIARS
jgi:hypothetical protein